MRSSNDKIDVCTLDYMEFGVKGEISNRGSIFLFTQYSELPLPCFAVLH